MEGVERREQRFSSGDEGVHGRQAELVKTAGEVVEVGSDFVQHAEQGFRRSEMMVRGIAAHVAVAVADLLKLFNNEVECSRGLSGLMLVNQSPAEVRELVHILVAEHEAFEPVAVLVRERARDIICIILDDKEHPAEHGIKLVCMRLGDFPSHKVIFTVVHDLEAGEFLADDFVRELELILIGKVDGEFVVTFLVECSERALH